MRRRSRLPVAVGSRVRCALRPTAPRSGSWPTRRPWTPRGCAAPDTEVTLRDADEAHDAPEADRAAIAGVGARAPAVARSRARGGAGGGPGAAPGGEERRGRPRTRLSRYGEHSRTVVPPRGGSDAPPHGRTSTRGAARKAPPGGRRTSTVGSPRRGTTALSSPGDRRRSWPGLSGRGWPAGAPHGLQMGPKGDLTSARTLDRGANPSRCCTRVEFARPLATKGYASADRRSRPPDLVSKPAIFVHARSPSFTEVAFIGCNRKKSAAAAPARSHRNILQAHELRRHSAFAGPLLSPQSTTPRTRNGPVLRARWR